ncbi:hypothetical protein HER32_12390 [Hymenobacter sp. BT18]|uniref:hypothetical protein n=1 Tax=Hymenobacter sp. BT18 TaxID=2835648 RepID=UPI00143E172F|nr:hypothetical protein [Hymenobacter sp. BT18]QIX61939.1 hypothetical protein HER32_12390 [Hymenobacter sp. BT18]
MRKLRSRLALLLLLCFVRVLLPDTWVLALHQHTHTTDELAHAVTWPKGKALFSAKHQHCNADQFFKSAFEPAPGVQLEAPVAGIFAAPAAEEVVSLWAATLFATYQLRGPPTRA